MSWQTDIRHSEKRGIDHRLLRECWLPMLPESFEVVTALMRQEIEAEVQAGFSRLRRVPSTTTVKWLDYYDDLDSTSRAALHDASAQMAASWFFASSSVHQHVAALVAQNPALLAWRAAMLSARFATGYRYRSLRDTKLAMNDAQSLLMEAQTRARLPAPPRDDMPPELMRDPAIAHINPAKAPYMRKVTTAGFTARFGAQKEKKPGGASFFTLTLDGLPISAELDFSAALFPLRYGVGIGEKHAPVRLRRLFYEILWSGGGGWDYLTEENAEPSVALLCDFVEAIAGLFERVRAVLEP